jgi:hypothetical protein
MASRMDFAFTEWMLFSVDAEAILKALWHREPPAAGFLSISQVSCG